MFSVKVATALSRGETPDVLLGSEAYRGLVGLVGYSRGKASNELSFPTPPPLVDSIDRQTNMLLRDVCRPDRQTNKHFRVRSTKLLSGRSMSDKHAGNINRQKTVAEVACLNPTVTHRSGGQTLLSLQCKTSVCGYEMTGVNTGVLTLDPCGWIPSRSVSFRPSRCVAVNRRTRWLLEKRVSLKKQQWA